MCDKSLSLCSFLYKMSKNQYYLISEGGDDAKCDHVYTRFSVYHMQTLSQNYFSFVLGLGVIFCLKLFITSIILVRIC